MCGIAGVVGACDSTLIADMTSVLRHRGPDGSGLHARGRVHLGATRLSIIDPWSGAQPVYNETGEICVVFNGEIYNHNALRAELSRRGHVFSTQTDTEVVVHLYEEMGARCVERLHGMFAFAILDGERLLLARDRLGIKPLYYAHLPETGIVLFASEIKAILRYPGVTPRLDHQALAHYLILRHSVGAETYFDGIRSLPPGHTMTVRAGDRIVPGPVERYYRSDFTRDTAIDLEDAESLLHAALVRAVDTHLAADVEVGLTLSGGLDSTVLALLARERATEPLSTFTVGDDRNNTDMRQAALIAARIGSRHHTVEVSFKNYVDGIPALLAAEEKPNSLFGMPFYTLCQAIARHVKACLHGEGADELFGGYEDYVDRDARLSFIRERLPVLRHLGVAPSLPAIAAIKRLSSAADMNEYLRCTFELNFGDPLEQQHLVPVDKLAMAASLELRVPYLADEVHELVNRLPIDLLVRPDLGIGKYILKRLALKRFGSDVIDVVLRSKHGFPTAGMGHLVRFDRMCNEMLPDSYVEGHAFGRCFPSKRHLLVFDMFLTLFLEHRGDPAELGGTIEFMRARQHNPASAAREMLAETLQ
jgi:asparagine synthase (glutamine-hydrolysing)